MAANEWIEGERGNVRISQEKSGKMLHGVAFCCNLLVIVKLEGLVR